MMTTESADYLLITDEKINLDSSWESKPSSEKIHENIWTTRILQRSSRLVLFLLQLFIEELQIQLYCWTISWKQRQSSLGLDIITIWSAPAMNFTSFGGLSSITHRWKSSFITSSFSNTTYTRSTDPNFSLLSKDSLAKSSRNNPWGLTKLLASSRSCNTTNPISHFAPNGRNQTTYITAFSIHLVQANSIKLNTHLRLAVLIKCHW